MSLVEDNLVSILSCQEFIILDRTSNWILEVAEQFDLSYYESAA